MRRAIFFLLLEGCAGSVWPDPQPPRVVCGGYAAPAGQGYVAASECQQLPADPCWQSSSQECRRQAAEREEHNAGVRRTNRFILGGAFVVLLAGILIAASQ